MKSDKAKNRLAAFFMKQLKAYNFEMFKQNLYAD